jgi:hypothetical protein
VHLTGRGIRAALLTFAYLVIVGGALAVIGVGGYRAGPLVVAVVLAGGAAALTAIVLGRGFPNRALWTATPLVIGIALTGPVSAYAPASAGRIVEELDSARVGGFTEVDQERSGHGWCSPTCPVVVRTYEGPDVAPRIAVFDVAVGLSGAGLLPPLEEAVPSPVERIEIEHDDLRIAITGERRDNASRVVVRVLALR